MLNVFHRAATVSLITLTTLINPQESRLNYNPNRADKDLATVLLVGCISFENHHWTLHARVQARSYATGSEVEPEDA